MTAPVTTAGVFYGVTSDVGLVSGALTDAELNDLSSSPPVVSTADVAHKPVDKSLTSGRIAMALFKHHGFNPDTWPAAVRQLLWS